MLSEALVEPMRNGTARLVTIPSLALPRETLFEYLAEAGVLLLRAPGVHLAQFSQLIATCSSRMTFDPSREFVSKNAQLVNVGHDAIDLHCENANGPWRPDLAWFFCERASKDGGRTTMCDGVRLWKELSSSTRALFKTRQVKYCRTYPAAKWRTFLPSLLPGQRTPADVTVADLTRMLDTFPSIRYRMLEDDSVYAEYVGSAISRTMFRQEEAFANSIRGPYGGQRVALDDDTPIPVAVQQDITTVSRGLTEEIPWQDGDVAVVDNTRFMHGRTAYRDSNRRIYAALSFR